MFYAFKKFNFISYFEIEYLYTYIYIYIYEFKKNINIFEKYIEIDTLKFKNIFSVININISIISYLLDYNITCGFLLLYLKLT